MKNFLLVLGLLISGAAFGQQIPGASTGQRIRQWGGGTGLNAPAGELLVVENGAHGSFSAGGGMSDLGPGGQLLGSVQSAAGDLQVEVFVGGQPQATGAQGYLRVRGNWEGIFPIHIYLVGGAMASRNLIAGTVFTLNAELLNIQGQFTANQIDAVRTLVGNSRFMWRPEVTARVLVLANNAVLSAYGGAGFAIGYGTTQETRATVVAGAFRIGADLQVIGAEGHGFQLNVMFDGRPSLLTNVQHGFETSGALGYSMMVLDRSVALRSFFVGATGRYTVANVQSGGTTLLNNGVEYYGGGIVTFGF